ncbi:hypothetical protein NDU88_006820 [Pleurodeles waltl]|uniref:Uncharacterized protein n=1 Tax=Pleurodeles waltl TaxID=8319 RepID=A0AAV7N9R9_PLEWA|nr:hypothetical protein NDU88_006820 [Pleurodeles waltl]
MGIRHTCPLIVVIDLGWHSGRVGPYARARLGPGECRLTVAHPSRGRPQHQLPLGVLRPGRTLGLTHTNVRPRLAPAGDRLSRPCTGIIPKLFSVAVHRILLRIARILYGAAGARRNTSNQPSCWLCPR